MALAIRLNGTAYAAFTAANAERSMDSAVSTFSFQTTSANNKFIPIREGDLVEILADEEKIITGYVDEYGIEYDENTHNISIKGRSKTQDLADCTLPAGKEFENMSLFKLCKLVAEQFDIEVVNNVSGLANLTDISSIATGQKAFEFIEKFARKRQVLLNDDPDGKLVITRTSDVLSDIALKNIVGGADNNIKSGSRVVNMSKLYAKYTAQGQKNTTSAANFLSPKETVSQKSTFVDAEINGLRPKRVLEFYAAEADQTNSLAKMAKWEASVRRARSFEFKCTVAGHKINDILLSPNVLHNIIDHFSNLDGVYLCKKVSYNYDISSGSTSDLFFTNKKSYTLEAEQDNIKTKEPVASFLLPPKIGGR